jgi:O-methyltransferase involved in polyketide biosynthesis
LRARADEHRLKDRLFEDPIAVEWYRQAKWPAELSHWYNSWVQTKLAFRVHQIDCLVRARLAELAPGATVVELGCGLSSRYHRIGSAGGVPWVDLDLPDVIALRSRIGTFGALHQHVARSVLDRSWIDELAGREPASIVLIAEGLFYYLPRPEIDALFVELRRRLAGATMIFDVIGAVDFKNSVAASMRASTPILWMIDPPFERAMDQFGLDVLPGHEPLVVLDDMVSRFEHRFGPLFKMLVAGLVKIRSVRDRRSGIMIGRLRSLPS